MLIITLAPEKDAQNIQIFRDSPVIVNWMKGIYHLENYTLRPIFDEINLACSAFINISFAHVYRERNKDADALSKTGLLLDAGTWHIQKPLAGHASEYVHTPFY